MSPWRSSPSRITGLVRFTIFFLMTSVQMRGARFCTQLLLATGAVMAMGIYVELAEGLVSRGIEQPRGQHDRQAWNFDVRQTRSRDCP